MNLSAFRYFLIIALFQLFSMTMYAQIHDIKGTISDEQSKRLPYAGVTLKIQGDSATYRSAQSNEQGVFGLNNLKAGNYMLTVTMVGFETINKPLVLADFSRQTLDVGNIILKTSPRELKTVTIKGETPKVERLIDKTIINVDRNPTAAGTTVLELIRKLPGVNVKPDGQITLNGKSGVNVFMDGKPNYLSADDLAALLNSMPSSNIQQVEVMTNPSAKYDAAGNGGVINIVKKRNRNEGFNGSVNSSIGQSYFSRYSGGLTLNYKTKNYNLCLNNSYNYTKSFSDRAVNANILNDSQALVTKQVSNNNDIGTSRAYNPSIGLDIYLSKNTTLSLTGNAALRNTGHQTMSELNSYNGDLIKTGNENFRAINNDKPVNYNSGLSLVHLLDTLGRQVSIDLDQSWYRNRPGQYNHTVLSDASGNFLNASDVFLDQGRDLYIYAGKADYTQPLKNKGKLEAGIKSSYVKANNNNTFYNQVNGQNTVDPALSDYSVNSEQINAAYVNLNKTYQKLTVQAGLRAEHTITKGKQVLTGESVNQNYIQLFPTLFVDDRLNEQNSLNFKFGRRIERASYHELVPFRVPQTPTLYFQGNPNLKPQLSWHGEVTYGWHHMVFITFGYDIDRDYIRTFPYLDSNKISATRIPTNVQSARTWNVDLAFTQKLFSWWSTDNTLSVYQNSFSGEVNGFSLDNGGIPSVDLASNNTFHLTDGLTAEADFEYESKRQFISSTFGAYSTLNIGLKMQVLQNKGAFTLSADNIFQSEDRYTIDRYQGLDQHTDFHFHSRVGRLSFSYRFGSGKSAKSRTPSGAAEEQKRTGY